MTNGTLDGISLAIGGLQADMQNVLRAQDRILELIKTNNTAAVQALADHAAVDAGAIEKLTSDVEDLKSFRNRIYGIAAVIGVAASALSNAVPAVLKKMFS